MYAIRDKPSLNDHDMIQRESPPPFDGTLLVPLLDRKTKKFNFKYAMTNAISNVKIANCSALLEVHFFFPLVRSHPLLDQPQQRRRCHRRRVSLASLVRAHVRHGRQIRIGFRPPELFDRVGRQFDVHLLAWGKHCIIMGAQLRTRRNIVVYQY